MAKIKTLMLDLKSYYSSPAYQLGLMASYACQEDEIKKSMDFTFSEHPRDQPAEEIAEMVISSNADLVAASNYAWNYKKICQLLEILTETPRRPRWILLGGPNCAGQFGDDMLRRYPILSALVEGEGEPAFRDICSSLVDSPVKDPFVGSRNCVVRGENGTIVRPTELHRIKHLDEVPSPYLNGMLPTSPSPIFYETNRGCPYRCSFCYWGNGNAKIYRMSDERIREEMEFFAKNRVSSFWMADANFGIFKSDAEIAEMIGEINVNHGYPFKHMGVNWAKDSCDRVLEMAMIFKKARITCTTTLALQSVTPQAEEQSRRYSMAPEKFANLISSANAKKIDTYTDLIWGLPGENIDEFLEGLDAVISTGVPAILIHQLYLLPGTEFFEERERLGLTMLSDVVGAKVSVTERSDYAEYTVISHPKMSLEDMARGARLMGVSHLLHNHDLGRVVNSYLSRYGISYRQVYEFFEQVLLGNVVGFEDFDEGFLPAIRDVILTFAGSQGLDEFIFYGRLSDAVWFTGGPRLTRKTREPEVRRFMQRFYEVLCREHSVCATEEEKELLSELVDYNVLISPKPVWKPATTYEFQYKVDTIWRDMLATIHHTTPSKSDDSSTGKKDKSNGQEWTDLARDLRLRLTNLLTDEYLAKMREPTVYTVENSWHIRPSDKTADWLLSSQSKHCVMKCATSSRTPS